MSSSYTHIEHVTHLRVRYADTDRMGVVYYGKYFEYFEVARTEMLRACGLPYADIEEAGFGLPVLDARAHYHKGARYDDFLRISVRMEAIIQPRLEIDYEVFLDATNELIAEGQTTLVFISSATGRPCRPPAMYAEAMSNYIENKRATYTE